MKELKIKTLWAVDIKGIQHATFRYKKEAIQYALNRPNRVFSFVIVKRKVLTDKY
jgi:hypothetical protein